MVKMLVNDSTLTAIADAIRAKTESAETMFPSEMAALIEGIETGNPDFMAEGEYRQITGVATSSSGFYNDIKIPCEMDEAPTRMLIFWPGSGSIPSQSTYLCAIWGDCISAINRLSNITGSYEGGVTGNGEVTITLAGGYVTITCSSLYLKASETYEVYMWR
jgi:hypothetical protein